MLVAIVAYARRTGAFVIAEGIESDELLAFVRHAHEIDELQDLSIEGAQGGLLGPPEVNFNRAAAMAEQRGATGHDNALGPTADR